MAVQLDNKRVYFDYGACMYPEGLMGDQILYFNEDDIFQVVHHEYVNEDEELMVKNINSAIDSSDIPKGSTEQLNK